MQAFDISKTKPLAESGDLEAQYKLGWHYFGGELGVNQSKNRERAFVWWMKAAIAGHSESQNRVAVCYRGGIGTEQSYEIAEIWLRKAAENGSAAAQHFLANCYSNGLGVPKDQVTAQYWFAKAATPRSPKNT